MNSGLSILKIFGPVLLLAAGCLGWGIAALWPLRSRLPRMPIWLQASVAYFLGQGVIGALFTLIAIQGLLIKPVVATMLVAGVAVSAYTARNFRRDFAATLRHLRDVWQQAPVSWKIIAVMATGLFAYGFTAIGGLFLGDAISFYFAIAKVTAETGRLLPLPGYEAFSWVGLSSETLISALMALGMPGVTARIYAWVNYVPTMVALYGIARLCQAPRKAAFLAVVMAITSSAAIALWGTGKTDLFALGPAFAACVLVLASWDDRVRTTAIILAGIFAGFAAIDKFSYIPVLLPALLMLLCWHDILGAMLLIRDRNWIGVRRRVFRVSARTLLLLCGFVAGLSPLVLKNLVLFGAPFGASFGGEAWLSASTTLRLVLSYPLALTYGRYYAQIGTLSPLILAFIPLLLAMPRPALWRDSRLAALTVATLSGMVCWLVLMPSIFMPRYILANLLLLSVPAAAAAVWASGKSRLLSASVIAATCATILLTPLHVDDRYLNTFGGLRAFRYLANLNEEVLFQTNVHYLAHIAINDQAQTADKILLMSYHRYWLRSDLLSAASTQKDILRWTSLRSDPDGFWKYVRDGKFRFVLFDPRDFPEMESVMKARPQEVGACEIPSRTITVILKIGDDCKPQQSAAPAK